MSLYKNKYRIESIRLKGWDYSNEGYYFVTICVKDRKCLLGEIENGIMKLSRIGEIIKEEWLKTELMRKNITLDEYVIMPNHFHGIIFIHNENEINNINENEINNINENEINNINENEINNINENEINNINENEINNIVNIVETHCNASLQPGRERECKPGRERECKPGREREYKPGPGQKQNRKNNLSNIIRGFKSATTKRIHVENFNYFSWQSRFYERIIRSENELNRIRKYIINNPLNWGKDKENNDD